MTTHTQDPQSIELLQWQLSLLGTERPSNDTIYFLENNTRHNKTIDNITGRDILEYNILGYRPTIQNYLDLVKRINPLYLKQINDFIEGPFKGLYNKEFKTFIDYVLDFYGSGGLYKDYIQEKGIKPMSYEATKDILFFYLIYEGYRNGFILNNNEVKNIEPDFNKINIHREEIVELYILINGGFRPNNINPTLEDFKKGQYNKHSYSLIKFITQHILQVRPELVGRDNIQMARERVLTDLLNDYNF